MELNKHYPADQEAGRRSLLLGRARKGCPDCRRPLRDIDRYNRVFKTALLDELTRRFVARSTSEYAELVQQLQVMESGLEQSRQELVQKLDGVDPDTGRKILATHKLTGKNLQRQIKKFIDSVNKTEQPLAKVNDLYASAVAKLRDGQSDGGEMGQSLNFDQSLIQTGLKYRGDCLDAKAKWVMLWDWYTISIDEHVDLSLRKRLQDTIATEVQPATVLTDALRKDCRRAHLYIYAVEASVYFALFSVLGFENGKAMGRVVDAAAEEETRKKAKKILADCDARCRRLQGTLGRLSSVVEDARRMVESGLFHHRVTSDAENRFITTTAILFRGAGDWYYCVNGHPFIVRGDGLAVVEARCPDCNEPVGGRDGARPS
ncbi:hypothetical protein DRE_00719 [Drechslerella stenobrocha 248]|uniref:RZ-type domain-containing protein n=1 Tax=Drechslerella stenobrocha 248 TaxID=1043628 RepID=W7I8G8_9PEZI|nr:hypothetical protein DRE_00719 [Drechslerella stenobrocha 248]